MGFTVNVADDNDPSDDTSMTVVAPSTSEDALGIKYLNNTNSVVMLASPDWYDMKLGGSTGGNWATNDLVVMDPNSPISYGLPSSFAPAWGMQMQSIDNSNLPAGADSVAVRSGTPSANVVFSFNTGDTLADGSAAAGPRVALGLSEQALNNLTDPGVQLLDNVFYWADDADGEANDGTSNGTFAFMPTGMKVVGRWNLDQITAAHTTPGATQGTPAGIVGTQVMVDAKVANTASGHSLYFPGWYKATPVAGKAGQYVVDDDYTTGSEVLIPHDGPLSQVSAKFNPGTGPFQYQAYIRPLDSDTNATLKARAQQVMWKTGADAGYAVDTLNIVQRGRASENQQSFPQWKMSEYASDMHPLCDLQNAGGKHAGASLPNFHMAGSAAFPNGTSKPAAGGGSYQLTCYYNASRVAGISAVQKLNGQYAAPTTIAGSTAIAGFTVSSSDDISFGHKLRDDYPGDVFAGAIDQVTVLKK